MNVNLPTLAVILAMVAASGCANLQERRSKEPIEEDRRHGRLHSHGCKTSLATDVAVPGNRGTVTLEGFDRKTPLIIPYQGLTLVEALNAAGTPFRSVQSVPVEVDDKTKQVINTSDLSSLISIERSGETFVTFAYVGRYGSLVGMPLAPYDVVRFIASGDNSDEAKEIKSLFNSSEQNPAKS